MDDFQKAALLLKHLAPTERTQILSQLETEQREAIESQIAQAPDISEAELVGIVAEYQTWLRQLQSSDPPASPNVEPRESAEPVACLTDSRDLVRLKELLIREPGTVQAAVLCHLAEPTARKLFHAFDEQQQAELVERLPQQRPLSPLVWDELSLALNEATTPQSSQHERGQQLLKQLISQDAAAGVQEGSLSDAEQALVEKMKDD
ncbi:MAG: hypothetical protein HUJ26_07100 [Planctomycetaceae bacterium]|nr:hypothetical protein [Planctomycetaceae bacterium]